MEEQARRSRTGAAIASIGLAAAVAAIACGSSTLLVDGVPDADTAAGEAGARTDGAASPPDGSQGDEGLAATAADVRDASDAADVGPDAKAGLDGAIACDGGVCALAAGLSGLNDLAVDSNRVYAVSSSGLIACPLDGCGGAAPSIVGPFAGCGTVVAAGGAVYWIDSPGLYDSRGGPGSVLAWQAGSDGGPLTFFDYGSACAWPVAVNTNGARVVFGVGSCAGWGFQTFAAGDVDASTSVPLNPLAPSTTLKLDFAVSSTALFVLHRVPSTSSLVGIDTCPLSGCEGGAPTLLAPSTAVSAVVTDDTHVYFVEPPPDGGTVSSIGTCDVTNCATPTPVVTDLPSVAGLATDGVRVYWTDPSSGTVSSCATTGCATPTVIATGQDGPRAMALDATHVYWIATGTDAGTGAVMRAPK